MNSIGVEAENELPDVGCLVDLILTQKYELLGVMSWQCCVPMSTADPYAVKA